MTIQNIKTADLVRDKNPYLAVEDEFSSALAVLAIVQDGFTENTPENENIYFALEAVRRELRRASEILMEL